MEVVEQPPGARQQGPRHKADRSSLDNRLNILASWRLLAACVAPLIYLIYVAYYAVDVPQIDDWSRVPLVHEAIHGHLTLGALWAQYNESRIFVGNLVFVTFGVLNHFDTRALVFFNAALFIGTFWLFLFTFGSYAGKRLSILAVFVTSILWFSLADVQNALWGFQVSWYLVVLFLILMIWLLGVSRWNRNLCFALAILAAIGAVLFDHPRIFALAGRSDLPAVERKVQAYVLRMRDLDRHSECCDGGLLDRVRFRHGLHRELCQGVFRKFFPASSRRDRAILSCSHRKRHPQRVLGHAVHPGEALREARSVGCGDIAGGRICDRAKSPRTASSDGCAAARLSDHLRLDFRPHDHAGTGRSRTDECFEQQ